MKKKFYITTPIYYVNASPHIGHSYTNIAADTLSRHMRDALGKDNVWFLTGSDEHGQKIQKAADEAGLSPQEFVDKVVVQFRDLWKRLNISYDDFIRTTESRHTATVQRILQILYEKGDIYQGKYEGWYCTPCETFWIGSQVVDQLCPDCKRKVDRISETSYFFRTSKYRQWLIDYIEDDKNRYFIRPEIRKNEVLGFLRSELTDLCISRPKERLSWGIPLPFSPDHVTYVWFDALINYISAIGEFDKDGKYRSKWWDADTEVVHLIGKDILRHHVVYWPIMLHALDIRPPDTIFAHGWWMIEQAKMSKSRGNVVSPLEMVDKFGIEVYRYFLLRYVAFGLDGNFSEEAIIRRYNSDLANDLGNLVFRILTMIEKYFQGVIPLAAIAIKNERADAIRAKIKHLKDRINENLVASDDFNFSGALESVWELINAANKYIEDTKPWNLAKENKSEELKGFILVLVDVIRSSAESISAFIPQTSASIKEQIGQQTIKKGNPLFPRIDTSKNNT